MSSSWDPDQYRRFAAERRQPFDDLAALVVAVPGGAVVDLGCGTGELTAELHTRLAAARTLGVDSSPTMLQQAQAHAGGGVEFRLADAATWDEPGWDVIFANASFQWMPGHRRLLQGLRGLIAPGGQLAFQVPANFDHPSHVLAAQLAAEEPFASELGDAFGPGPAGNVLDPADYSEAVHDLGAADQHVRLQVYGHQLPSAADVVEWMKGTALTRYRDALPPAAYQAFLAAYTDRLLEQLGDRRPYFYPFKRILVWARFA
jgi:trans-aconitate 2-methyltransferase